ncbi:Uncharacterised protein [uncultured archaeon]|nr:Uncharacterised protein [uncultured archaeon]
MSLLEDQIANGYVLAYPGDIAKWMNFAHYLDLVSAQERLFEHNHAVEVVGHGHAGSNLRAFFAQAKIDWVDDARAPGVAGSDGVSIHGCAVELRKVDGRDNPFGEDPSSRILYGNVLLALDGLNNSH